MFRRPAKLGLSRKVVACYLFFCLVAVCWLTAGAVVVSRAIVEGRATNFCLTHLGSAAATLKLQLLGSNQAECDRILHGLHGQCHAAWCALVDDDGKVQSHTSPELVGRLAEEPAGSRVQWGDVTRIEYTNSDRRTVHEYQTPLVAGGRRLGELRVALEQPALWATIQSAAHLAPLALLAPLAMIVGGAWILRGLARPLTEIDSRLQQLARAPLDADIVVEPMPARDAASLGWNRLIDEVRDLRRQASQGHLAVALEGAAQARSDARFEEVLQRLSDGVAVTDANGRIEFANLAVAALLGHDDQPSALIGAALEERLLQSAGETERQELLSPAARRRTAVCELIQHTHDADRVLRVARLPLGSDTARRFVWSLRDITQQKLAEQTRDRFIDTATHELRTPLANIKAYAETLATSEYIDVELQKEFCNTINSEVTRLARFIDDLLSISSMEAGALMVDRQKVETERLFAEVLAKVEPLMQKKAIDFQVSLAPKMPELVIDKDKIIAVVVNLLGNAAKYTPSGGRVSLKVKTEDGQLRIAVEDNGIGIAAEELPKLFEKFFRSDDPRVQAEVGSGLGLSLAREVVRMHGGEVIAESVLNQGSTFTVSLPLA